MTTNTQQPRPSDRLIPWYIVLFFVAQTVTFAFFTYIAKTTYTGLVTEQAYEKGLAYNSTLMKAEAQEALGYSSKISYSDGKITFLLKDRNSKSITDAKVTGVLFRPVRDGMDMDFDMKIHNGFYSAQVTLPAPGLWEIRVHAVTSLGTYQASKRIHAE
jgi:nitrogen fixation protein FixH